MNLYERKEMTNGVRFWKKQEGSNSIKSIRIEGLVLKGVIQNSREERNSCIDINRGNFTHTLYFLKELEGKTISLNCGGVGV